MNEFEKFFSDEFFIIDSNNLSNINTKLYGFLVDEEILTNETFSEKTNITGIGAYVYVKKTFSNIQIFQDYMGSYGIYVYKNEDTFCISNSFIKLLGYVKNRYHITINEDYVYSYLPSQLTSISYKKTLINEIENIPRNYSININIKTHDLSYVKKDYGENSISLDSQKAFDILDDWYCRWTSIIRKIKSDTNNISVDLSGGFDTRLIIMLVLSSNIDLNQINIHSSTGDNYIKDFEIASKIAEEFNFKLNDNIINIEPIYFEDINTIISLSFCTDLSFHNQMHYNLKYNKEPYYKITGYGGGVIRGYERQVDDILNISKKYSSKFFEHTKKVLEYNEKEIKNDFNDFNYAIYHRETHNRYHHGKPVVGKALCNEILLNPLIDSELGKLKINDEYCPDKYLLIALILTRYCPKLLEFDIEGNRTINKNTIKYAKLLNEKYPFNEVINNKKHISKEMTEINKINDTKHNKGYIYQDIYNFIESTFFSYQFRKSFEKYFKPEIYDLIAKEVKQSNHDYLRKVYPAIAILKSIEDVSNNNSNNFYSWLNSIKTFPIIDNSQKNINIRKLLDYITARIDIKNEGNEENKIKIIYNDDENININEPKWLKDEKGSGIIIHSYKTQLNLKIKCFGDGLFRMKFRGIYKLDKNKRTFPIYIDFKKFLFDNQDILQKNILVSHDTPFEYSKKIKDKQEINISLKWNMFTNDSIFEG